MLKFIDYVKKNSLLFSTAAIIVVAFIGAILVFLNNTYAMDTHTITFNRYEDTEIMNRCETDVNGKLSNDCVTQIGKVCAKWSLQSQHDGAQTNQVQSSDFANMTFNKDTDYYCVSGTSGDYNTGCYECKTDKSIVHWASSSAGNTACPDGYKKIHERIDDCKVYACYECKDNKNYMVWRYSSISDDNCPSGYNKTNKTQAECKPIEPNACYVCKDNSNVMKWDNNGNSDPNCSSGYNKTNIPEIECKPIENPQTGNIAIFFVWILGIGILVYSGFYYRSIISNKR